MTTIDASRRTAARVAGLAYVATFAVVVAANFGIHERLVARDAAETARRILAAETLFRVGVVCDVLYCAGSAALIAALYVLLAPVSRLAAALAASWRTLFVVAWSYMTLELLTALRMLRGAEYLRALEPERVQALARLALASRGDAYYGTLLFFALAATATAWALLRSRFVPRWLALFGIVSSAWCALCAVAYLADPGFANVVNLWWFDSPMGLFELATGLLLLARGLPRAQAAA
jgi:Domain of unknown function (DUF4386)